MDQSDRDLIDQLCTKIGCVMEDVSVTALTTHNLDRDQLILALAELDNGSLQITALTAAARSLMIDAG